MECLENINLRYVSQDCANPLEIGRLKLAGYDGKCLSWGYEWSADDGEGEPRFEYCNDSLEQNIVFCDDKTIRSVANDSLCLTLPASGSYDSVRAKYCDGSSLQ